MSIWTISGQTGKALGSSTVDLEVTNYTNVSITHSNQGTDSLSFFVRCDDRTSDPAYLPEYLQSISIFRSGTRQFVGYVTKPKFVLQNGVFGWKIEAQNGWQELDRVALSDTDKEYLRAQGSLSATITDIINKAIAGGARISLGSIGSMFDIPPISFRGTTCGASLIELLRVCADAVAYFDYSAGGNPSLNIVRRGSASGKTFTFGTDELVEPFECSPIPGATPTKITVAYATRDSNGIVTETVQTAGSGADTQSVVLTAPNFADFQTKAAASEISLLTSTTANWTMAYTNKLDPKIKDIVGIPTPSMASISVYTGSVASDKTLSSITGLTASITTTSPNTRVVVTGSYKDWMSKLGITAGEAEFEAEFFWLYRRTVGGGAVDDPDWATALLAAGAVKHPSGLIFWNGTEDAPGMPTTYPNGDRGQVLRYVCRFTATAISRNITSLTALRDPGDYGTLAPPADLAANLLAAQNFVPYEGQFGLSGWHSLERLVNRKISFGGLTSRLSSIAALVQSETLDVQTGAKTVRLGMPVRAGNTALARLRKLGT